MANKHEFHAEFCKLPATGIRARELGDVLYFTGKRCSKGHLSPRYASSGNCVQCIAAARGKVAIANHGRSSKRSAKNQIAALAAADAGFRSYEADAPCPSGHYTRFVSSNNCITCDAEQRKKRALTAKWARVKKEYGLSPDDVEKMLHKQARSCAICLTDITAGHHIDHSHTTGKVRGLLCQKCNQAIGLLKEDATLFASASQYIRNHYECIT